MELLSTNANAFALLYVVAYRAQRTTAFNRFNLKPGQALVGDYRDCGMTERGYRTAKQLLAKHGFATFKATSNRKQTSLRTKDRAEAERLAHAKNEAVRQPSMNLQIAQVYLQHGDPALSSRTCRFVRSSVS